MTYSCAASGGQHAFQHGWNPENEMHNERHRKVQHDTDITRSWYNTMYSTVIIWDGQFSPTHSQQTVHSSFVRVFCMCVPIWFMFHVSMAQHIEAETKWPMFCRRHFQMHFREWKHLIFIENSIGICSLKCNWQLFSIGWGDGLAPNRRQVITLTFDDPVHWRIDASLGLNDSMQRSRNYIALRMELCIFAIGVI